MIFNVFNYADKLFTNYDVLSIIKSSYEYGNNVCMPSKIVILMFVPSCLHFCYLISRFFKRDTNENVEESDDNKGNIVTENRRQTFMTNEAYIKELLFLFALERTRNVNHENVETYCKQHLNTIRKADKFVRQFKKLANNGNFDDPVID